MSNPDSDIAAWAKDHRACFEIAPLLERRGGAMIRIGYTLELYASLPMDKTPGTERREEAARILERLREIAESLEPAEESGARVEIEPPRTAAFMRPSNDMQPEVLLSARIFHSDDYFKAVTPDEKDKLALVDKKLTAMGLRRSRW